MAEGDLIRPKSDGRFIVECPDHVLFRIVDTPAHAYNLEAKHLREQHNQTQAWPDVNLSAVATLVCMAATLDETGHSDECATTVLGMWESLTGLPRTEAVALAERVQASREPITAHVAPF